MKYLIFFLLLLSYGDSYSQKTDTVLFRCLYNETIVNKKTKARQPVTELFYLDIGKNISHYYSEDKRIGDSLLNDDVKKGMPVQERIQNINKYSGTMGKLELWKNISENKILVIEKVLINKYFYLDSMPQKKWAIYNDTATINGILCQKASINFRGRKYTAWYAPGIPLSTGPWKFYGLPGLIVKITDSEGAYSFELLSIKANLGTTIINFEKKNAITTSAQEIIKLKKTTNDNPLGQMEMLSGTSVKFDSGQEQIEEMIRKAQAEFDPIELSIID